MSATHHQGMDDLRSLVRGLAARLRLERLEEIHDRRTVLAIFTAGNACISVAILSAVALVAHLPLAFPSLGPTAYLLFQGATSPAASPRNTIVGHLVAVLAGYLALVVTGLTSTPPDLTNLSWPRVGAVAIALGLTAAILTFTGLPHPPSGATTLIVALGLLHKPEQLVIIMVAVVLLTAQGFIVNRLAGLPYPLWSPRT